MADDVMARLHAQGSAAVAGDLVAATAAAAGLNEHVRSATARFGELRASVQGVAGVLAKPVFLGLSTAMPLVMDSLRDSARRAGGDWARQTAEMSANWRRLQDVVAAPLFERLSTTVLPRLGSALRLAVAGGERGGLEGAMRGLDAGLGGGGRIVKAFRDIASVVRDTAGTVRDWLLPAIGKTIDLFQALPTQAKSALVGIAAVAAVAFGGPLAIAAGLVAAAVLVHKNWSAIAGFFSGLWRTIRSGLGLTSADFRRAFQAIRNVATAAFAVLKLAFRALAPIAEDMLDGIVRRVRGMARVIGGVVKVVSGLLTGDWSAAWKGMKQIAAGAVDVVLGTIQTLTAPARAALEGIWKGLGKAASLAFGAVKTVVVGVLNWLIAQVNTVIQGINSLGVDTPFGHIGVHVGEIGKIGGGGGGASGGARGGGPVGKAGRQFLDRTKVRGPLAQTSTRSAPAAPARGAAHRTLNLNTQVNVDGRVLARTAARVADDEAQWGRA